jgi:solute carrier family 25 carnitine/acylcarnitine transporter 20/29
VVVVVVVVVVVWPALSTHRPGESIASDFHRAHANQAVMGERPSSAGRMVGTGSSTLELVYGSISGMAFGLVSPLASQPFDTLKTKMQAESRYAQQSMDTVVKRVLQAEGATGLYRGIVPIVLSTGVQKSALFSANAGARRACERSGIAALSDPIPFTSLSPSVLVGGIAAGTARTVVETPFELAKVRYQTGGGVKASTGLLSFGQLAELYTGAAATWGRGTVMLTSFFVLCDYSEKAAPELMSRPLLGGFLKGGVCATLAWVVAWPLEVAKNKVQGTEGQFQGRSTLSIVRQIAATEGMRGLYRGILPGALRSFVANGAGMAVFQFTQSLRKE